MEKTKEKKQLSKEQYETAKKIFSKLWKYVKRNNISIIQRNGKIKRVLIAYTDISLERNELSGYKIRPEVVAVWAKPIIQNDKLVFYFKDERGEDYVPAEEVLINY